MVPLAHNHTSEHAHIIIFTHMQHLLTTAGWANPESATSFHKSRLPDAAQSYTWQKTQRHTTHLIMFLCSQEGFCSEFIRLQDDIHHARQHANNQTTNAEILHSNSARYNNKTYTHTHTKTPTQQMGSAAHGFAGEPNRLTLIAHLDTNTTGRQCHTWACWWSWQA